MNEYVYLTPEEEFDLKVYNKVNFHGDYIDLSNLLEQIDVTDFLSSEKLLTCRVNVPYLKAEERYTLEIETSHLSSGTVYIQFSCRLV